ncbi:MAG: 2-oxoacid:acceptor oxidoreductase family protein [Candidatus Desulfacyla sp.]
MINEILIAGFGGQGIMLMGKLLAYGAIYEGLEVTFYPSYGPEMRGGTANCTVVISEQRIGSPIKNSFTAVMAMNQASLSKFENRVAPGGVLAYNETLIDAPPKREDVKIVRIPANKIAAELGNLQVANMVAVGGVAALLGVISLNSLVKGLTRELPKHRHHLIALNEEALKKGMELVQESMKGIRC